MSDQKTSTSGDNSDTSGSDSGNKNKDTYSKEFVDKLLTEKKNYATKVQTLESKLKDIETSLENKNTEELTKKNEFKTLYESEKAKRADLEAKLSNLNETTVTHTKRAELTKELLSLGLDPKFSDEALKLTNLKEIHLDPETNTVIGAKDAAKSFFEKYQGVFFKRSTGNKSNHEAPRMNGKISTMDLAKMSQAEKMNALRERHRK